MADQLEQDLRALADKAVAASREQADAGPHPGRMGRAGWRRQLLGVAAAVAAGALLVGIGAIVAHGDSSRHEGVVTTAPPSNPQGPLPAKILDVVARQVAATGTPTGPVRYTQGLRSEATPVLDEGDLVGGPPATSDERVWVVVVPGSFRCESCTMPGARPHRRAPS